VDLLWEEFQLPIWVTEFDWNANNDVDMGDHTLHAEQIHNFYTLMFSLEVLLNNVTIELGGCFPISLHEGRTWNPKLEYEHSGRGHHRA